MPELKIGGKKLVLTPSNWIQLDGVFTPKELRIIANAVEKNYKKINVNKNR